MRRYEDEDDITGDDILQISLCVARLLDFRQPLGTFLLVLALLYIIGV